MNQKIIAKNSDIEWSCSGRPSLCQTNLKWMRMGGGWEEELRNWWGVKDETEIHNNGERGFAQKCKGNEPTCIVYRCPIAVNAWLKDLGGLPFHQLRHRRWRRRLRHICIKRGGKLNAFSGNVSALSGSIVFPTKRNLDTWDGYRRCSTSESRGYTASFCSTISALSFVGLSVRCSKFAP